MSMMTAAEEEEKPMAENEDKDDGESRVQVVAAMEGNPAIQQHTTIETVLNMTPENKEHFLSEKEAIFLILTGIGDDIYSTDDACKTANEIWIAIERLQQGESLNVQDVKTNLFWEFGKFTSRDGESMESYYSRFYKLMNELTRNNLQVTTMQVNQYQNEVNDIRAERIAKSANPLALLAAAQPYSDNYYQAPKPQRSNATSSSTRPSASTRHKGKEIAKPVTPQSEEQGLKAPLQVRVKCNKQGYSALTARDLATMQRNAGSQSVFQQTQSRILKNKVEANPRKVKSSLKNKDHVFEPKGTAPVQHSKLNTNSDFKCVKCNGCMLSDNHDLYVLDFINNVNARAKSRSRPTGRIFTIVRNTCPLTRITTTTEVPLRKSSALDNKTPKPVVTLVYSRKPRKSKTSVPVNNYKVIKSVTANNSEPSQSQGSIVSNVPSSSLDECKSSKLSSAKIMGYGDYQIGNVTISRVYYVEGLGHNLFSVGQFCDSNLEVAFRQHTCYIRNLEGVDLLTGSRGDNLYTLSLGDMMASSPICLLSKASKTKSWLWHRRLSHLNFGAINHLARHGLVRGLPKLKFEKDHLCSACALGKSTKKPHKPKSEDTNQEKLYLLHMDLCGPMRVASVNGKKYILVIVDDYSRFTWVKCLRSKDEAPAFIINFLKMIQVRLKETVRRIRTDNGTEFVNQTLREYYEKVGISHETSVARSPQQNGVVERRNRTLIEAARTMLIYAKAPLFLWAEAVATACYTQNRSMIRRRHGKTPYELLHNKPPDLSYLHVFGALCYPTNDSENLGKLQPKADIAFRTALHEITLANQSV
ncbi:retrovirus-related pol polyprotein from transposon TNT 1-94 [Tanacetum coccineum]